MAVGDALAILKEALETISSVIVNGIVNFISLITGGVVNIPSWVIQLILIGLVVYGFLKWSKRLPWVILILLGLFLVAFLMGLFGGI